MSKSPNSESSFIARPERTVIAVSGNDRERFLQGMISNDVKALAAGQAMLASILTVKGKLIADFTVYNTGDAYWLEMETSLREVVQTTLDKYIIAEDVALADLTQELSIFTLLGPKAKVTQYPFATLQLPVDPTFQVFVPRAQAQSFEASLTGIATKISPETYEVLRIEAGIPKFGVDVGEDHLLMEVPFLEKGISYTKGCYIGQETVARLHSRGGNVAKRLMGLAVMGSSAPISVGAQVFAGDKEVGKVTSACFSPKLSSSLALSMIHREAFAPGSTVQIRMNNQSVSATVVSLPL